VANTLQDETNLCIFAYDRLQFVCLVVGFKSYFMKVLNISLHDYANMAHENANALRSVGVNCHDVVINYHKFRYKSQGKRLTIAWLRDHYKTYDVIQLFHSEPFIYKHIQDHPNVVVYHTGTRYREAKERLDQLFYGRKIITDQCEFLLHNPTFNYLAPHTTLKPVEKSTSGKLIIGHYPSNHVVKGTLKVDEMLAPFQNDFDIRIDIRQIPHEENLKRISECHIYVELFAPEQNGKPYGCFGVTAFEATALGCLVVTNNINRSAYEDVYGSQPFLTPNTEAQFMNVISGLHDREQFELAREAMHAGFHGKHSLVETGLRIKELIC
jgi:hypothetical protein